MLGGVRPNELVLDIGAGDNSDLQRYVNESQEVYIPFDVRLTGLAAESPFVQGSANQLPFLEGSVSTVFERFTFQWLEPDKRVEAQKEAMRVMAESGRFVTMAWDWSAMGGSKLADRFRWVNEELLKNTTFDPYYGREQFALDTERAAAAKEILSGFSMRETRFNRGFGDFRSEIEDKLPSARRILLPKVSNEATRLELSRELDEIEELLKTDECVPFKIPDIVVVEVERIN